MADGAQPSNVERGYILRKLLRRAVRYGRMLGMQEPFLAKVLPRLIETMGPDYHELVARQGAIAEILTLEEEAFIRTLKRGGKSEHQSSKRRKKAHTNRSPAKMRSSSKTPMAFPSKRSCSSPKIPASGQPRGLQAPRRAGQRALAQRPDGPAPGGRRERLSRTTSQSMALAHSSAMTERAPKGRSSPSSSTANLSMRMEEGQEGHGDPRQDPFLRRKRGTGRRHRRPSHDAKRISAFRLHKPPIPA